MTEKLVRDRIPDLAPAREFRRAAPGERRGLLLAKLHEECAEVAADPCTEEIADVLEVLRALADDLGVTWPEVEDTARRKRAQRGGFEDGVVMRTG